ncbi:Thioredoxin domain-containing protein [Geosporobacter subterraneus DSM 17957]|uniref:Thioredoxin domain-containing protein n=1 Tax=Geosporobacter subterraneus DSM 17957 TaxID=1121919 RepID=A0A1M6NXA5_9FIRM|nr:glutaredoxin domain-containing protein [Geosporobacter subterraneus]SHK00268.1 Thioredoxin domain-containing protein [Geosporobacter subterraneus DSM 17957]
MKPILMFMMETCPYCREALRWMEELKQEDSRYQALEINMVDEQLQPDLANQYDYYYVPTYYVDGAKLHEGAATKEKIRAVFEKALEEL